MRVVNWTPTLAPAATIDWSATGVRLDDESDFRFHNVV